MKMNGFDGLKEDGRWENESLFCFVFLSDKCNGFCGWWRIKMGTGKWYAWIELKQTIKDDDVNDKHHHPPIKKMIKGERWKWNWQLLSF